MLPIILVSFRRGPAWSLLTAFVFSLIQLLLGVSDLTYCQTLGAVVGSVLLDFLIAFTVLGLAGLIAKPIPNRLAGVCVGTLSVCLLRYLCSFLSGYIVWKDYDYAFQWMTEFGWGAQIASMGENALCWLYSAVYNGTYMRRKPFSPLWWPSFFIKCCPSCLRLRRNFSSSRGCFQSGSTPGFFCFAVPLLSFLIY